MTRAHDGLGIADGHNRGISPHLSRTSTEIHGSHSPSAGNAKTFSLPVSYRELAPRPVVNVPTRKIPLRDGRRELEDSAHFLPIDRARVANTDLLAGFRLHHRIDGRVVQFCGAHGIKCRDDVTGPQARLSPPPRRHRGEASPLVRRRPDRERWPRPSTAWSRVVGHSGAADSARCVIGGLSRR